MRNRMTKLETPLPVTKDRLRRSHRQMPWQRIRFVWSRFQTHAMPSRQPITVTRAITIIRAIEDRIIPALELASILAAPIEAAVTEVLDIMAVNMIVAAIEG